MSKLLVQINQNYFSYSILVAVSHLNLQQINSSTFSPLKNKLEFGSSTAHMVGMRCNQILAPRKDPTQTNKKKREALAKYLFAPETTDIFPSKLPIKQNPDQNT